MEMEEENKMTAVEWLVQQLNESIGLTKFVDKCDEAYMNEILTIIQQAKAMEKEQLYNLIDFINERHFNSFRIAKDEAEQYYNETYNSERIESIKSE